MPRGSTVGQDSRGGDGDDLPRSRTWENTWGAQRMWGTFKGLRGLPHKYLVLVVLGTCTSHLR